MVFIRRGSALGHVLVGWTPMAPGPLGMYAFSIPGGDKVNLCVERHIEARLRRFL
jgi:hypothetical protein